jgi:hypothetical protein
MPILFGQHITLNKQPHMMPRHKIFFSAALLVVTNTADATISRPNYTWQFPPDSTDQPLADLYSPEPPTSAAAQSPLTVAQSSRASKAGMILAESMTTPSKRASTTSSSYSMMKNMLGFCARHSARLEVFTAALFALGSIACLISLTPAGQSFFSGQQREANSKRKRNPLPTPSGV